MTAWKNWLHFIWYLDLNPIYDSLVCTKILSLLFSPKSSMGQNSALSHKIEITTKKQRLMASTKVATRNINSKVRYSPKHLGIVSSSLFALWLIDAGSWQTNNTLWSATSLSGPMMISDCSLVLSTLSTSSAKYFWGKLLLRFSSQSSHLSQCQEINNLSNYSKMTNGKSLSFLSIIADHLQYWRGFISIIFI